MISYNYQIFKGGIMKVILDSGFNKALTGFINNPKKEVVDNAPPTEQQRQNIKENFRLYTRHLIQIIDKESLPI